MTKIIFLFLIFIFQIICGNFAFSQSFQWALREGGINTRESARKTIFDPSGNMYVIGTFGGLNGGTTLIGNISLTSIGAVDVFIAKYDINRNLVWVRQGGSIYYDYIYGLELDESGNVYICGIFSKSIGSNSVPMFFGNTTLQPFGKADLFIVKFSNNGDLVWAQSFGSSEDDQLNAMSKDAAGNFYITGGFKNNISFGDITLTNSTGYFRTFVTKFNNDGNFLWAKNSTGTNNCIGVDIAADEAGNTVTTGFFSAVTNFENITLNSQGNNDIMLVKYNSSGNLLWAKSFGSIFFDYGLKVDLDNDRNIFLTGSFETILDFGNNVTINSLGGSDVYVCKLDMNGNARWARNSGGLTINGFTSDESPSDVITDSQGNCYLTGYFAGKIIFDNDTLSGGNGSSDVYLVRYDEEGFINLIKQIKSLSVASYIFSSTLYRNISDEIFISGGFVGNAEFDNINLQANGSVDDLYITKISSLTLITNNAIHSPGEFNLSQNYPNPFNPVTKIKFDIPSIVNGELTIVNLKIFNVLGKEVQTLLNEKLSPGSFEVEFNGSGLTGGIYFYKLQSGEFKETKRMILLK